MLTFYAYDKNGNNNFDMEKNRTVFGVYLHGQLECYNKYDLVACNENIDNINTGIYDCKVINTDSSETDAILYFWYRKLGNSMLPAGLIVDKNDKENMEYTESKFYEEAIDI